MTVSKKKLGSLFIHISVFFWGSSFIFQKILLQENITPFYTVAFRFIPIILFFSWINKSKITRKTICGGVVLGAILFLAFISQTMGLKKIDASISAFLTSTSIILIPGFNYILYKKKFYASNAVAIISAMIGITIFNYNSSSASFSFSSSIIITLVGSLCYTLHIIYEHYFLHHGENPINLHFVQCTTIAILGFIFGGIFEPFPKVWSPIAIGSIVYLSIFASIIGFGLQIYGQSFAKDPIKAGLIISLEPVWAFFFSMIILQELFSIEKILGILFISTGIIICEFFNYKRNIQ